MTPLLVAAAVALLLLPAGPARLAGLRALSRAAARPAAPRAARGRTSGADLPLACDLLAACLAAGAPPDRALAVVAGDMAGAAGEALALAARRWRIGGSVASAFAGAPEVLAPIASAFATAERSGAAVAPLLAASARELRDLRRVRAEVATRRAGVLAVLPLGLCFLPAFVLLGVVPVVAGLVSRLG